MTNIAIPAKSRHLNELSNSKMSRWDENMLKTPSNNIIPSPSYDFFKIAVGLKLLYAKNFSLQCWKLILCTFLRSWENHPSKSPETWFVGSLDGFLLKWRRVLNFFDFCLFYGSKTASKWRSYWIFEIFWPMKWAKIPTSLL